MILENVIHRPKEESNINYYYFLIIYCLRLTNCKKQISNYKYDRNNIIFMIYYLFFFIPFIYYYMVDYISSTLFCGTIN